MLLKQNKNKNNNKNENENENENEIKKNPKIKGGKNKICHCKKSAIIKVQVVIFKTQFVS